MLYRLSCFFRDLAVGSDASMAQLLALKLKAATREELSTLRDASLKLTKSIDDELEWREAVE